MGGLLAAGQPGYAAGCAWNLGWAGWAELCLGGLLDGQGLFHTHLGLRLGGELLAGLGLRPVADTQDTPGRAEGLGLRLVSGWHTLRPVSH